MREIKFDYVWKMKLDGKILRSIITMDDLEAGIRFFSDEDLIARRQFTGLKDCNGVEIYEFDIVNSQEAYQSHFIIEWGNSGWVLFDGNDGVLHDEHDEFIENVEVIGNIYENPEILEEGRA